MTKRKSGLVADDSQPDGVTSLCNMSDGDDKRKAAFQISQARQRSQRYETITFTQLTEWPEGEIFYKKLSSGLQAHVIEYYVWGKLHESSDPCSSLTQFTEDFDDLTQEEQNSCAKRVCDIHTVFEYTLRTQIIPEYLDYHTTGGELSKHWQSIPANGAVHKYRQRTVTRMKNMPASQLVPGATGLLIDHYGWSLDPSDRGMQFMLHRDFARASTKKQKVSAIQRDEEEDSDDEVEDDTRTTTESSYKVAGSILRAMYTAVVVLRREVHPRSVLCPLTSKEWLVLTHVYGIPEHHMEGTRVIPTFDYSKIPVEASKVTHELDFLKYRSSGPFFRDLCVRDAHYAVRAMYLARQNLPTGKLSTLQREFQRVTMASSRAAQDTFDHGLTVIHTLLQRTDDIYEPNLAAHAAVQSLCSEYKTTATIDGHILSTEVRRQLVLYQQERLNTARKRKQTTLAARNLDAGGLEKKQADGRLPSDLKLITNMMGQLWEQIWVPVWTNIILPWLEQSSIAQPTIQDFLAISLECSEELREASTLSSLTQQDVTNMKKLLQLELSFLRQQTWLPALVSEFTLTTEDNGQRCYTFKTTRAFKTLGKHARGSLPAATQWLLVNKQAALVHTILLLDTSGKKRMFTSISRDDAESAQAVGAAFYRLGANWCGIPALGPHALRTYWVCMYANSKELTPGDYPALASRLQVSVDTLVSVYLAPSKNSPAALLARELYRIQCAEQQASLKNLIKDSGCLSADNNQHRAVQLKQISGGDDENSVNVLQQQREQQEQHEVRLRAQQEQHEMKLRQHNQRLSVLQQQQQSFVQQQQQQQLQQQQQQNQHMLLQMQTMLRPPAPTTPPAQEDTACKKVVPNGKKLASVRAVYSSQIKAHFQHYDSQHVKLVYDKLCTLRKEGTLPADAEWFEEKCTYFADNNLKPFRDHVRKLLK
jgi:hypothetical protein